MGEACATCGSYVMEPDVHRAWHAKVFVRTAVVKDRKCKSCPTMVSHRNKSGMCKICYRRVWLKSKYDSDTHYRAVVLARNQAYKKQNGARHPPFVLLPSLCNNCGCEYSVSPSCCKKPEVWI